MINMIGTGARNNPEYLTLSPAAGGGQTRGWIEGNEGEKIVKIEQFLLLSWPGPVWLATTGNNRISKQFRTVVGVANECDGRPHNITKKSEKKTQKIDGKNEMFTHGCWPYPGLSCDWAAASSSIRLPGSMPYILLYCICCAVNIAAWLSMMHLKNRWISTWLHDIIVVYTESYLENENSKTKKNERLDTSY